VVKHRKSFAERLYNLHHTRFSKLSFKGKHILKGGSTRGSQKSLQPGAFQAVNSVFRSTWYTNSVQFHSLHNSLPPKKVVGNYTPVEILKTLVLFKAAQP